VYACVSGAVRNDYEKKYQKKNKNQNQVRVSLEWDPCQKKTDSCEGVDDDGPRYNYINNTI